MNSVADALAAALNKAIGMNSGTLTFVKDGTTVSATVYKSILKDYNRDPANAGYEETYDNLYVLAKPSDVQDWGLQPMTSEVKLDGVDYMTGRSINKTTSFWTIFLRARK